MESFDQVAKSVQAGTMSREEGVSTLIAGLFDVHGPSEAAAAGLRDLDYEFGGTVFAALDDYRHPKEARVAQERLGKLDAEPLVKWLCTALSRRPGIWYGEGVVIAAYGYHWDYAVRVCGWLHRKELVRPLVVQLEQDELGSSSVRRIAEALRQCGADEAVELLGPLMRETRLVWTRPANQRMPLAERAFEVLAIIATPKAEKALRKGLRWWNLRRFEKYHATLLKDRRNMWLSEAEEWRRQKK